MAGFKYFELKGTEKEITITLRGSGTMELAPDSPDGKPVGTIECEEDDWTEKRMEISCLEGVHALYFRVKEGTLDFAEFAF